MEVKEDTYLRRRLAEGALSGWIATLPMTAVMGVLHRYYLPGYERYPLPPRLITERMARRTRLGRRASSATMCVATWAAHFGYGASSGALYGGLVRHPERATTAKGIGYGLAVWAGSYLGWLPAAGILTPATRRPLHRNALLLIAHVVWGGATGWVMRWLARRRNGEDDEEGARDRAVLGRP